VIEIYEEVNMNKKIYACYSESHRPLLEQHFLPSIPDGFDVVLRRLNQACRSGEYMSADWGKAVQNKIQMILEAIEHEKEPFVFSDVDIRFYDFRPEHLVDDMAGGPAGAWDVRCQNDHPSYCAGFMFIRPGQPAADLFKRTLDYTLQCNDDQTALNVYAIPQLRASGSNIQVSLLPHDRYWNIGPSWSGEVPTSNIAIHHGNWVVGIANKLKLLGDVLAIKSSR
jgi:hypothetical protein